MKGTHNTQKLSIGLLILSQLLIIVGYNYWSYRCGFCTVSSLLKLSAPAVLLILSNLVACVVLLAVKRRARQQLQRQHCHCGTILRSTWVFCPNCGNARQQRSPQGR